MTFAEAIEAVQDVEAFAAGDALDIVAALRAPAERANELLVACEVMLPFVQGFAAINYEQQEMKEAVLRLAQAAMSEEVKG